MTGKTKNDIQLIDLGLPSGTLWADRNIGAESPEDYGDYFRFGETTPCTKDSDSYIYDDIKADIAGTDRDAATVMLGGKFRMPTIKQCKELINECSREWTIFGGVKGVMVTGPNGNSIFLLAAGYRSFSDGSLYCVGSEGCYWSASPNNSGFGHTMFSGCWGWGSNYRAFGFSVRAVKR